jgi:hypothetical protein
MNDWGITSVSPQAGPAESNGSVLIKAQNEDELRLAQMGRSADPDGQGIILTCHRS